MDPVRRPAAWSRALAALALLACMLPLAACETSLARLVPEGAQLPLPAGEEPAADPLVDGTQATSSPPEPAVPPTPSGEPREVWVPDDGAGASRPPPPDWDPSEDAVVRVMPDGSRVVERLHPDSQPPRPAPVRPMPVAPLPVEPLPIQPPRAEPLPAGGDPWLPGAGTAPQPSAADPSPAPAPPEPAPPAEPAVPSGPARTTDDLGPPPGGTAVAPFGPQPAPGAAEPPADAPAEPPPARLDDPWLPGGAEAPPPPPPAAPTPALTPEQRAFAQVTRLRDRPGAPDLHGYPADLAPPDDAGMALTPGGRPALVVFFDDGARASDLQAARLLPMIVRLRSRIVFVPVDRSADAVRTRGGEELARRYLDHVPTLAVLDAERRTRFYGPGMTEAADVERALLECLGAAPPAQPTPVPPPSDEAGPGPRPLQGPPAGAPTPPWDPSAEPGAPEPAAPPPSSKPTEVDPWLPGGTEPPTPIKPPAPVAPPTESQPARPSEDPWLPGGSTPADPRRDPEAPPAGAPNPFGDAPPPRDPGTAEPPVREPAADGATPGDGGTREPTFTAPGTVRAREHAARLRASPGDAGIVGFPADIVAGVPADRVLATGLKPCVIVFYDDASKASDLQAAEFLPLLSKRQADVDVVLVDVGTKARWDEAQKRVVRTYYNFYVPTTVVLAPNRAPIKSWYSRISAQDLDRAIDQALDR